MRQTAVFPINDPPFWKTQLLHWAAGHELAVYFDSNRQGLPPATAHAQYHWECLAAAGAVNTLEAQAGNAFVQLEHFQQNHHNDWTFGFFGYDLKNETERLISDRFDGIGLPDLGFFQPRTVAGILGQHLEIQTFEPDAEQVFLEIKNTNRISMPAEGNGVVLQERMSKQAYLEKVEHIRRHIVEGDVYEMNLCQEFFAEDACLDPVAVFERLNGIGKAPFSSFVRWRDRYLLSASPERFLKKEGQKVISQPIKGTRRRGSTPGEDELIRQELAASEKDRAENVMIVDLVRNDLARNCLPGSVRVAELFGIYSFETVHQMVSTISGKMRPSGSALALLRDAFPPGSMTGAPKVMAMELIEQYENTRRGLYSGAVGYFDPGGDFDFNVVIRSILYNAADRYVSVQVGGAIVYDSVPEQEYEECLLKAEAMRRALR
jgi:para-aminobenzoate synthetase component 1